MIQGCPELSNFSAGKVLVTERFEPLRAGDFVLRTTSVSPLEHAKGRKALDPAKNADAFFRKKIAKRLILFFILSEEKKCGTQTQKPG